MPTYRFQNLKTGIVYEDFMSIAEMEKLKRNKNVKLLPPTQMNIVSSVGSIDSKTDGGWKDHLNRIADKHPTSPLAERYRRQGVKEAKTRQTLQKHRARAKGKI